MSQQHRVYAAWFEGLFVRALGSRLTPVLIDELRAAGLDLERPLAPAYPAEVRQECLRLLREHLYPSLSDDQAYFALGRAAVDGFLQTFIGQSFGLVVRFLGPRALLKRAGPVMASASNYVTAQAREVGPFRWEVTVVGGDVPPSYFVGMARAALDLFDLADPHAEILSQREGELRVGLGWAPAAQVSTR